MTKNIPELDKLFQEVGTYRKSSEFKELFEFVKKFPDIAPYNAMLIHIQKPGSRYVASASQWKQRFSRDINPGARPLVILRPFGPVAFVFELGDTTGKEPFPDELLNPFKVEGKITWNDYGNLIENLKTDGISYSEVEYGPSMAGSIGISKVDSEQKIVRGQKEIWVKIYYNMVVNSKHEKETRFATILHELGHLYCGHLGTPYKEWWGDRRDGSKNEKEFEAESVCYLVCERMGINNPSAAYLNGYLDEEEYIPDISIDTVLKSVNTIESMINKQKKPRKEIIIREIQRQNQQTVLPF